MQEDVLESGHLSDGYLKLLEALIEEKERNVVFLDIRTEKEREIEYPHHKNSCNVFNLNGKCDCKEEPKEECFYCDMRLPSKPDKERKIFNWHLNGHKEEPKPKDCAVCAVRSFKTSSKQEKPKPTLNKQIDEMAHYQLSDEQIGKIISLFKDTLLKEILDPRKLERRAGLINLADLEKIIDNL